MDVSFSDIENAYFFVSMEQQGANSAYLCIESGEIFLEPEFAELEDELPEDVDDPEKYISIPHKNDLDLGQVLVMKFVSMHLPEELEKVHAIFSRRGAYSRYKDLLESKGMLEKWFQFEEERETAALREWCKENNIRLKD